MKRMWLASPLGQRKKTQGRKDYVNRTIANAISNCVEIYTPKVKDGESLDPKSEKSDKKETSTQADLLLKLFLDRDDVILFKDERELPYISLLINSHRENWRCGTKNVKDLLSYEFYKKYKKSIGSEVVKNVISIFDGSAKFDGDKKTLFNRVALVDGVIWYDLTNSDWQAVKITNKGWEIVNEPPILFKRFSHQHAQVLPVAGGSIYTLFNYINISRDDHKILLIVLLISYFVPNFPHPAIVLFGSAGAAKTTVAKILRRINDPTLLEAMTLPKDQKELIQKLDHHYFPFFDNISHLSEETSDLLCKAITGSGFSKRVLYTDDDDIIYNFKRCIGLNGISVVATKPDLLERSILIELEKVDDSVRKGEEGIHEKINRDIPLILGGIFDVLVKAIEIKPTIKLEKLPRMADFMLWGCAIAEAAGIEKQLFIDAYNNNLKDQVKVAINDNPVALAVVLLMNSRVEWRGTATELLSKLNSEDEFADRYGSGFPKAPNMLVKRLNELKTSLKAIGILYESENDGAVKTIILTKVDVDMNSGSSTKPDDTDDVF